MDNLLTQKREALAEREQHFERTVAALKSELSAPETEEEFWTTAIGHDDAVDLALERIDAAQETLCMATGDPDDGFDLSCATFELADRVESAARRGVQVKILSDVSVRDAISADAIHRWEEEVLAHDTVDIRATDDLPGTFVGLDRVEVCIEIPNPLDPRDMLGLVALRDSAFASRVASAFRESWQDADPV